MHDKLPPVQKKSSEIIFFVDKRIHREYVSIAISLLDPDRNGSQPEHPGFFLRRAMEKVQKPTNVKPFLMYWINRTLLRQYREHFRHKVNINRELSELVNAYMIECLQEKGIKPKL